MWLKRHQIGVWLNYSVYGWTFGWQSYKNIQGSDYHKRQDNGVLL